jgi:hypothetical protein
MTTFLLDGIYAAHDAINEYAMRKRMADPPRTTCVVCVVQKGMACWAHVGDSRLYQFSRRAMLYRTRDHSAVQQLVDEGLLGESEMGVHPDRNKLYNSVGGFMLPDIEVEQPVKLQDGDVLFLCTDVVRLTRNFTRHAEGSVLVEMGDTQVLCTASVEENVPPFLRGKGRGWVTAEYGMLPRATHTRSAREAAKGKQTGRTQEIQRLIGRALRAVVT